MAYEDILYEKKKGVARITINRPKTFNSFRSQTLTEDDFAFLAHAPGGSADWSAPSHLTLKEIERLSIEAALRRTSGNRKEAAQILGIDRSTLYDKLKRHGIERE